MVLDTTSQILHVLDGTGTDAVLIAGRAQVGDEQPLVLIDPTPDHRALALISSDPVDEGPQGRGRPAHSNGVVAAGRTVTVAGREHEVPGSAASAAPAMEPSE